VVARSPYLVLHARLGDYDPAWLDQLVASAALFEVWAHEASIAPIEDYPLHRRALETRHHWSVDRARRLQREQAQGMRALLEHVRANGPVNAADFGGECPARAGWWGWKKEKAWLEAWFALGELMVARRDGIQRVYDLASRVCPRAAAAPLPSAAEVERTFVERRCVLGVTQARWVHDHPDRPRLGDADLRPLVEEGTSGAGARWPAPATSTATTGRWPSTSAGAS
jgi:uncharacterized protein YcaQ